MYGANKRFRLLLAVLAGSAMFLIVRTALAAVDLSSFEATPEDGQVLLDWETGSELDFAGFFMLRNSQDDGDYSNWPSIELLDTENGSTMTFVPGRNDFGAEYHFADQNVQNGTTYCYVLQAVNNDSSVDLFPEDGALCVVAGLATPTPAPSPSATGTSAPSSTPATAVPTATLVPATSAPTRTPRPTFTGTIDPTETPTVTQTPTVTLTPTETPLPTFLPTLTATSTLRPTRTPTPTVTPTSGPLLESTREAEASGALAALADRADLTLREFIVSTIVVIGLAGGLGFLLVYVLFLRSGSDS